MAKRKKAEAPKEFISEEILVTPPPQEAPRPLPVRDYGIEIGSTIWIGRYAFSDGEGNNTLDNYIKISKVPINDFKPFTFTENGKKWLDNFSDDKISIDGDIISVLSNIE